jgi:putative oxidoreductase
MNPAIFDRYAAPLGRSLVAALFIISGLRKLLGFAGTVAYFGRAGLPVPDAIAVLVIALELGGGLWLLSGRQIKPIALALAAFTVAAGFVGHAFWAAAPEQFSGQLNNFLKNLAISGGLLMIALREPAPRLAPSRPVAAVAAN